MAFRKNKPGCPCCNCTCPDEGPSYPRFSTIRIEITGLASSYDFYNEEGFVFGIRTSEGTVTGLDAANGTHLIREELEATMNAGCIVDGEESYPLGVYSEDFTLYYTVTTTDYPNFDCDPLVPFPPTVTVITYEETVTLSVTKEGDHWYKVTFFGSGASMLLSGCQVFACENNFDASTDGTLTDDQRLHDIDAAGPWPCSDGDIWFTPASFASDSDSTVCGRAREFSDPEIVGTITATLE